METTHSTLKTLMDLKDRIYLNGLTLEKTNKNTRFYKEVLEQIEKDKKEIEEIEKYI